MNELKKIEIAERTFTANGIEYFIETDLSIQRSVYAEAAKLELEAGVKIGKQIEDWKNVYDLANEQKFADIVVLAYNNRRGYKNFYEQHPPVLKLCACFINAKDEDRRTISDDLVTRKINDWAEEGISMQSFFVLALTFLKSELEGYRNATQDILNLVNEFQEKLKEENLDIPISV